MRTWKQLIPYLAGATLAITAVGILKAPKVSAAVRAALVEVVAPSHPVFYTELLPVLNSAGPDTAAVFAVSNITVANISANPQQVLIYTPIFSGTNGCGSTPIGQTSPSFYVSVPAGQTVSLSYPSPLVFTGYNGHNCIAANGSASGFVSLSVTGFTN